MPRWNIGEWLTVGVVALIVGYLIYKKLQDLVRRNGNDKGRDG